MKTPVARSVLTWLLLVELMILLMVAVGGITRLTDSGLSMVEWKPLMGSIPPLSEAQWQDTFARYKEFPQYKIHNKDMSLAEFKGIFFWEYLHRLIGRSIGLVFALPYVGFLLRKKLPKPLGRRCGIALLLGGSQGLLGWWMVKSGLVDVPYVSHFRLAAHLLLAFAVFCYILWILLDLYGRGDRPASIGFRQAQLSLLVLTIIQITYGALVAGLDAGYAYNTFPKMMGRWMPPGWQTWEPLWQAPLFHPGMVQWMHRTLGWLLFFGLTALWLKGLFSPLTKAQRSWLLASVSLVWAQFLLGVLTLILHVPISIAVTHQVTALILLGSMVALCYHLKANHGNELQHA